MHFNIKSVLRKHGFVDKNIYKNIYIELYKSIKEGILKGDLQIDLRLPPTRILAKDMEVSRSTVIKAYDLLLVEGFIRSITGSGYYINAVQNVEENQNDKILLKFGGYPQISKKARAFQKNRLLPRNKEVGVAFRPGLAPLDVFPTHIWRQLSNEYWSNVKPSELSYSHTFGIQELRENIVKYLKVFRNIHADPKQIVITTGSLHSLFLIASSLIDKKNQVVVENPTYPLAMQLFKSMKADIRHADVDSEGIMIDRVDCDQPKIIYITPSNQYPSGNKMSLNRRLEVLQWATEKRALIIEDDYDHEFSNWNEPVNSLYSLDMQDRVVYLGTFNKLLHPSLRIGYMIIPRFLSDTIEGVCQHSNRFVAPSLQVVLSKFIERDHLNKHIRNVMEVAQERKKIFVKAFQKEFKGLIELEGDNHGMYIIGHLPKHISDKKLAAYLKNNGIVAHALSNYFIGDHNESGLVMGYSSVHNTLIKESIRKMKSLIDSYQLSHQSFILPAKAH